MGFSEAEGKVQYTTCSKKFRIPWTRFTPLLPLCILNTSSRIGSSIRRTLFPSQDIIPLSPTATIPSSKRTIENLDSAPSSMLMRSQTKGRISFPVYRNFHELFSKNTTRTSRINPALIMFSFVGASTKPPLPCTSSTQPPEGLAAISVGSPFWLNLALLGNCKGTVVPVELTAS